MKYNEANVVFYTRSNKYGYDCGITLNNCTTDAENKHVDSFQCNNRPIKNFIHPLKHIETRNCDAVYEFVGTLTPDVPTTMIRTQKMIRRNNKKPKEEIILYTIQCLL